MARGRCNSLDRLSPQGRACAGREDIGYVADVERYTCIEGARRILSRIAGIGYPSLIVTNKRREISSDVCQVGNDIWRKVAGDVCQVGNDIWRKVAGDVCQVGNDIRREVAGDVCQVGNDIWREIAGDVPASNVADGDVADGDVLASDVATGDVLASDVAAGDVLASDVANGDVAAGDVLTSDVRCCITDVSSSNQGRERAVREAKATANQMCPLTRNC